MNQNQIKSFKLEKRKSSSITGANRQRHDVWECTVRQIKIKGKRETHMKWQWGIKNGKFQIRERTYCKGLQKRTPWEQALQECNTMIDGKLHKGYVYAVDSDISSKNSKSLTPEKDACHDIIDHDVVMEDATDQTTASEANSSVPFVMLAWELKKYPNKIVDRCGFIMPKLDGIFAMANLDTGELWARSRKPIVRMKHIQEAVLEFGKSFRNPNRWIVGELYRHGWEFQKISV